MANYIINQFIFRRGINSLYKLALALSGSKNELTGKIDKQFNYIKDTKFLSLCFVPCLEGAFYIFEQSTLKVL